MRRVILLYLFLFPFITCFAQDAYGYYDVTENIEDGMMRIIASPSKFVEYKKCPYLMQTFFGYSMHYDLIKKKEEVSFESYYLCFFLPLFDQVTIPKGGRMLMKFNDGDTLSLVTDKEAKGHYSNGYYLTTPEYIVSKDKIDSIIRKGVVKLRIETEYKNIDIELTEAFARHTEALFDGIEKRRNKSKQKDSDFYSDF